MSWQDRDYARHAAPQHAAYVAGVSRWSRSMVNLLLAVNIGVFILCMSDTMGAWLYDFGEMRPDLVLKGQLWRLVTSQYLHAPPPSLYHILFNMLGLHFLGRPLEAMWGRRKFFLFYTAAGLIGSLVLLGAGLVSPDKFPLWVAAIGASGCILGLLGVCAVLFPTAQVIVLVFPMTIRSAAILFTVVYVLNVNWGGPNAGGDLCHLGGLAFGVLWALYYEQGRLRIPRMPPMARPAGPPRRGARPSAPPPPPANEIERILAKIHEQGIGNLSKAEKTLLREATERQQEADRRYGRTDRL